MKVKFLIVLFFSLLFTTFSYAEDMFNEDKLKELITKNNITTIDELVGLLPSKILMNPLLVHSSHALNLDRVSFENPRVILFNEDTSLIMAFTKNPGKADVESGDDTLEIINFNQVSKVYEMKELVFDGKKIPYSRKIETNPNLCLSCHGKNPRPIFNDYNNWPGFYGSFGTRGYSVKGTKEFNGLRKFLDTRLDKGRYKDLDLEGYAQDHLGIKTTSRGMGELADKIQFSINLMFGAKTENLMWDRLGAKLIKDPNFARLAPIFYSLGEETNRCGPIRTRVKKLAEVLRQKPKGEIEYIRLLDKINSQTITDFQKIETIMLDLNAVNGQLDHNVDSRGMAGMIYSNLKLLGEAPEGTYDQEAFFSLLILMESTFRDLGYDSSDLSTTPGRPTGGIFHLKRLGQRSVDEQFFQNLFGGIVKSKMDFKTKYDSMNCEQIDHLAKISIGSIPIANAQDPGILY